MTGEAVTVAAPVDIETRLATYACRASEWSSPMEFDLSKLCDRDNLASMFDSGAVRTVRDEIDLIGSDLYDLHHPGEKHDVLARLEFVQELLSQGVAYGRWFLFPWSKQLVRYPGREDLRALRTSRNRNLITSYEQGKLYASTIAVFGLSVGSKVVEQLVASGIGGTMIMGDPDHVTPSNLNRTCGGMSDVGMTKVHRSARDVCEVDPYIRQVHFAEGITSDCLGALAAARPDIIFDEVDDLSAKAVIRRFAQVQHIPVIMATDLGDRSIIDVERYDLPGTKLFNGRLKNSEVERLAAGGFTDKEKRKFMLKVVGIRHVTARVLDSVMQIDKTLGGLPQLGVTASAGGSLAAVAAREILLSRRLGSGRYVYSPKSILTLAPQASFSDGVQTLLKFARS